MGERYFLDSFLAISTKVVILIFRGSDVSKLFCRLERITLHFFPAWVNARRAFTQDDLLARVLKDHSGFRNQDRGVN